MKKIKILFILPKAQRGGAETQLLCLLQGIDKKRFDVFLGILYGGGELKDTFANIKHVQTLQLNKKNRLDVAVYSRIAKLVRDKKIDIIHSFMGNNNAYFPAIIANSSVPVGGIMSSISDEFSLLEKVEKFKISKILARTRNLNLVSCSYSGMNVYLSKGFSRESVHAIPNGIDHERFGKGKADKIKKEFNLKNKFVIGTVGRLTKEKNHEQLIAMFSKLSKEYPNMVLLIAGGGELKSPIENLISRLNLQKQVILAGSRKDVPDILAAIDIFVLPSLTEGWPNALGEAMAAGLPVISYPVGDVELIIKNGINGIIAQPNIGALKDAIVQLMRDKNKMRNMGINANKTIKDNFTIRKMVSKYESFYIDLLKRVAKQKAGKGKNNAKA